MTYSEAKKELHRVGCAHATGDSYRAMAARTIAFFLTGGYADKAAPKFYAYFQKFQTDDDVFGEYHRLHQDPGSASGLGVL
jgi:hypothetical protein